ncbi:MAG: M56 family metallopeptidase [Bacteroidota bacterium]
MSAMVYLLQVSACMGLFYGFYYLMLSRLTFFTINRWYLVITLVLSFVIPLLTITVHPDSVPIIKEAVYVNQLQTFQAQGPLTFSHQPVIKPAISWLDVLKTGYLLTVVALSVRLIIMLVAFFANIKSKKNIKIGNVHVLHGDKKLSNGSFLNYIFLNDDELSPEEIQQIIEHEMLHVKLQHSVDRILCKIAQIVLWFNPFVYLYARAIEENHEFEVDREIGLSNDKSKYADMLLHLSVARQGMLYNSFSMVPLKKRIAMLFTKPTNHMKKVIYLLALPVVMLSCLAFARLKNDVPTEKYSVIAGVELSDNIIKVLIDGKSYDNDVLYNISGSCIKSVSVKPVDSRKVINGKWVDVTVTIQTKNGEIVYMTALEKENLVKERHSRATTGFYSRIQLTDNDGKPFDKAMINTLTGSVDVTVKPEDKIGFVVDGVFYNENDIRFIDPKKSQAITVNGDVAVRNVKPGEYAKGFTSIFTIKTTPLIYKKADVEAVKSGEPVQPLKKQTGSVQTFPVGPITQGEKQKLTKLMVTQDQFYTRTHMVYDNKPPHDKITFKYTGGSASANLGVDDIAGIFIDGEFYDEDAIKKITAEQAALLEPTREGFNPKKVPDGPYAVPFCFKTRVTAVPVDTIRQKTKTTQPKQQKTLKAKAIITGKNAVISQKSFLLERPGDHQVLISIDSAADAHNRMLTQEVLNRIHYPQFYSRVKFTAFDGKDYDYVACAIGKGIVTKPIKLNAKTGLLIDGVFYDEDAVKNLPVDKTKALEMWPDGMDAKKIPKGYVAALSLRTKTVTTDILKQ